MNKSLFPLFLLQMEFLHHKSKVVSQVCKYCKELHFLEAGALDVRGVPRRYIYGNILFFYGQTVYMASVTVLEEIQNP